MRQASRKKQFFFFFVPFFFLPARAATQRKRQSYFVARRRVCQLQRVRKQKGPSRVSFQKLSRQLIIFFSGNVCELTAAPAGEGVFFIAGFLTSSSENALL